MAEKIVSPGVFTKEIDASFLPSAIGDIGAAIVGPTVKGPAMVPTVVSSYAEFQSKFGDEFQSGSNYYSYLTSIAAQQYLRHSNKLTVVRILDGNYTQASASILTGAASTGVTFGSGSFTMHHNDTETTFRISSSTIPVVQFIGQTSPNTDASDNSIRFFDRGASTTEFAANLAAEINATPAFDGFTAGNAAAVLTISGAAAGIGGNGLYVESGSGGTYTKQGATEGGTSTSSTSTSFVLKTHDHGHTMNNIHGVAGHAAAKGSNGELTSGSRDNIRWEVSTKNNNKGTFTLLIRQGNDTATQKSIVETWNNLSLDPQEPNYIGKMIGDSVATIQGAGTADPYISYTGNYPNKSKYVYVQNIKDTPKYLNEGGTIRLNSLSSSLPVVGSGSYSGTFGGGSSGYTGFDSLGNPQGRSTGSKVQLYDEINATDSQGYALTSTTEADGGVSYMDALQLLANGDEYDINLLLLPGILDKEAAAHTGIITKAIDVCEARGDCFLIYDTVRYSEQTLANVTGQAETRDTNYGATYWPWVQIADPSNGVHRWVPPSTVMAGIYGFNDKIAAPWFAPAGLNRGGLDTVIQAGRKLTHANRDTLYESNVNPIATFPGQGVTVFGQKTLQKKNSALDRINVRRLLIRVKKFIASSSRFLVFEQNTAATRRRFLGIVNPFLENVQSQSGLSAFRVVMDESNNTPDTIDRNQLVGQLFLQPTRTAEFIVLDFTVQRSGATFPE